MAGTSLQTVLAICALTGGAWGGVLALDARYAPLSSVEDLVWSQWKRDLRELRDAAEQGDESARDDYEELLERFCRRFPEDRECD